MALRELPIPMDSRKHKNSGTLKPIHREKPYVSKPSNNQEMEIKMEKIMKGKTSTPKKTVSDGGLKHKEKVCLKYL